MEIDEFWYRYMNANSSAILLDELWHFFRTNFRFFSGYKFSIALHILYVGYYESRETSF